MWSITITSGNTSLWLSIIIFLWLRLRECSSGLVLHNKPLQHLVASFFIITSTSQQFSPVDDVSLWPSCTGVPGPFKTCLLRLVPGERAKQKPSGPSQLSLRNHIASPLPYSVIQRNHTGIPWFTRRSQGPYLLIGQGIRPETLLQPFLENTVCQRD